MLPFYFEHPYMRYSPLSTSGALTQSIYFCRVRSDLKVSEHDTDNAAIAGGL